jgi:hypothetical protein
MMHLDPLPVGIFFREDTAPFPFCFALQPKPNFPITQQACSYSYQQQCFIPLEKKV